MSVEWLSTKQTKDVLLSLRLHFRSTKLPVVILHLRMFCSVQRYLGMEHTSVRSLQPTGNSQSCPIISQLQTGPTPPNNTCAVCCVSFLRVLDPRLLQWLLIARYNSSFVWQVSTYYNVGKSVVSWQLLSSWSVSCFRFYVGFFVWNIELVV